MLIKGSLMTDGIMFGTFQTARIISLLACLMFPSTAFSKCVSNVLANYINNTVEQRPVEIEHQELAFSGGVSKGIFKRSRNSFRFRDTIFFENPFSKPGAALIFGVHSYDDSLLTGADAQNFVDITYILHRVGNRFDVVCSDNSKIVAVPPDGVVEMYSDEALFGD